LQPAEDGKRNGNDEPKGDQKTAAAAKPEVYGEEQEPDGDAEIPPGVPSRAAPPSESAFVEYLASSSPEYSTAARHIRQLDIKSRTRQTQTL
jgi:hypothetical protein